MLRNEAFSVRLGGIYALQGLSQEDPEQYRDQIVGLLSTFVNDPVFERIGVSVDVVVAKEVIDMLEKSKSQ